MARRSLLAGLLLAAAGSVAYRRRLQQGRPRVHVGYEDGSTVALAQGSPAVAGLLALADELIGEVR